MSSERRSWPHRLKVASGAVAVIVVCLAIYGVVVEPRLILDKRQYTVYVPGLPEEMDGTKIAVFSDLQVGMWWANLDMAERVVQEAADSEVDAILILGDFVYSESPDPITQIEIVTELLNPLTEGQTPVFAVLGNHDYEVGAADEIARALRSLGIEVLRDESAVLRGAARTESSLHVVGIGPHQEDGNAARVFDGVPPSAPRLVMMHNPLSFPDLSPGQAPLAVAGHTHCGQIALPGTPHWSYLSMLYGQRVAVDGWVADTFGAEGNRLFVTCGIGFSDIPMRIAAAPQLVIFQLTP